MAYADTIYRNAADSFRARVFKREGRGAWDFDLFDRKRDTTETFSVTQGDYFATKADALAYLSAEYGITKRIDTGGNWTL